MEHTIYLVTSLPRTGTTSLCEMAKICGLKSLHILKNISLADALNDGYNFFADTPFYSPEFLVGLLESIDTKKYSIKFIYSHRDFELYKKSLDKLLTRWSPSSKLSNRIYLLDHLCYNNLSDSFIKNHYNYISTISKLYNVDLLDYKFTDGWEKFCDFIDCKVPSMPIPKLDCLK
jgi:hypothetical protein